MTDDLLSLFNLFDIVFPTYDRPHLPEVITSIQFLRW